MRLSLICLAFILLLNGMPSQATSIQQLGFDEVVANSVLVFEGEVVASESVYNKAATAIITRVRFRVFELLKGELDEVYVTLNFAGGNVGDVGMVIPGMRYPQIGEHGLYFVKDLRATHANPLVGWSQGHYLIKNEAGESSVSTADGKPIYDVQASPGPFRALSMGIAKGILTKHKKGIKPLRARQFKDRVRSRMRSQPRATVR